MSRAFLNALLAGFSFNCAISLVLFGIGNWKRCFSRATSWMKLNGLLQLTGKQSWSLFKSDVHLPLAATKLWSKLQTGMGGKGMCLNELLMYGRTKCVTNAVHFPVWIGHKPGGVQLSSNGWCQVWSGILETWVRNHSPGKVCMCVCTLWMWQWLFYLMVKRELKCKPLENFTSLGQQLAFLEVGEVSCLLSQLSWQQWFFLKVILVKL